jgi:23S rRNA maturation mini-RNase III
VKSFLAQTKKDAQSKARRALTDALKDEEQATILQTLTANQLAEIQQRIKKRVEARVKTPLTKITKE